MGHTKENQNFADQKQNKDKKQTRHEPHDREDNNSFRSSPNEAQTTKQNNEQQAKSKPLPLKSQKTKTNNITTQDDKASLNNNMKKTKGTWNCRTRQTNSLAQRKDRTMHKPHTIPDIQQQHLRGTTTQIKYNAMGSVTRRITDRKEASKTKRNLHTTDETKTEENSHITIARDERNDYG